MLAIISKIIWSITSVFLVGLGIYLSAKIKFIHIRFPTMLKCILSTKSSGDGVSPFQTLMMTLATKIGVGSIVGIAISIYYGGSGSIFWLIVSTFVITPIVFIESYLGSKYKTSDGELSTGGPHYYIKNLSKSKSLTYALFLFLAYTLGYIPIQINTIVNSSVDFINLSNVVISFILTLLLIMLIFKGTKMIINACTIIVPFMSFVYIGSGIYVLLSNASALSGLVSDILQNAFNIRSFGLGILTPIIIGIQRSVFSSEAGTGSCAISSAVSNTKKHVLQSYIQVIGIYFTNFFICGATILIILTSEYQSATISGGLELVKYAFNYHFGNLGFIILTISVILFALSTVITGYYYSESAIKYLGGKPSRLFKFFILLIIFMSGIVKSSFIWDMADILIAVMTLINISGIFALRKEVFTAIDDL